MEDLIQNIDNTQSVGCFFLIWPCLIAVFITPRFWSGSSSHSSCWLVAFWNVSHRLIIAFWDALYHSVATYLGATVKDSDPASFKRWKLIHRFVGILAVAYVTALFIISVVE